MSSLLFVIRLGTMDLQSFVGDCVSNCHEPVSSIINSVYHASIAYVHRLCGLGFVACVDICFCQTDFFNHNLKAKIPFFSLFLTILIGDYDTTFYCSHRLRMGSKLPTVVNAFFGTSLIVMLPSYYFCYKRREHKEHVIEMMMKYNQFGHATDMDPEPPLEDHPFWEKAEGGIGEGGRDDSIRHDREYRGMMKERKHWQKPQKEQSLEDIFKEKR